MFEDYLGPSPSVPTSIFLLFPQLYQTLDLKPKDSRRPHTVSVAARLEYNQLTLAPYSTITLLTVVP